MIGVCITVSAAPEPSAAPKPLNDVTNAETENTLAQLRMRVQTLENQNTTLTSERDDVSAEQEHFKSKITVRSTT